MAIFDNGLNPALPGYDPKKVEAAANPTPPITPAAAPQPTFRYTQAPVPVSPTSAAAKPVYQGVDEAAIREQTRKSMQSSIDAIDANYVNLISQEQVQGQDRAGQTRAVNARSGTLGQDFGNAAANKTAQFNQQQVKYLEDEKMAKVNSVLTNIQDRADQRIKDAQAQAEGTYQRQYGEYQAEQENARKTQEAAKSDLFTLAKSGYNLDTMDPNQKAEFFQQAGYDDPVLGELIYNSQKPKAEQVDWKTEKLADGKLLFYGTDPLTGQIKQQVLDYDVPPDYQFTIAPDGTPIIFNKTTGDAQVAGEQGQFGKPEGSSLLSATDAERLGVPYGTTQAQAAALGIIPQAQPTADQSKVAGFAQRVKDAIDTFNNTFKMFEPGGVYAGTLGTFSYGLDKKAPNALKPSGFQQHDQAARNFINAVLRRESGAAISPEEFKNAEAQYLPVPGDDEVTINQKKANMNRVLDNFTNEAGPAWGQATTNDLFREFEGGGSEGADPKAPAGQPLSSSPSVNTKTLASAVLPKYPDGAKGGQCITFLHQIADFPSIGDGKKEKFASVDKFGIPKAQVPSQAKVGMILITDENPTYGHGAMINAISADGKYARVTESNYKSSEAVSHDRVVALNSPHIYGAIQPKALKTHVA
jgi:hypothetical protein